MGPVLPNWKLHNMSIGENLCYFLWELVRYLILKTFTKLGQCSFETKNLFNVTFGLESRHTIF